LLKRIATTDVVGPRSINGSVPRPLDAICAKAAAREPTERYADVQELLADVEHYLADEPVRAHRESTLERLGRWSRRHRTWVRAGAAALVLVAILSILSAIVINEARTRANDSARAERAAKLDAAAAETRALEAKREVDARIVEISRRFGLNLIERGVSDCTEGRLDQGLSLLAQAYVVLARTGDPLRSSALSLLGGWSTRRRNVFCGVHIVEVSPAMDLAASGHSDGTVRLWYTSNGELCGEPMRHEHQVTYVTFSPDDFVALTKDRHTARLWDAATGRPLCHPIHGAQKSARFTPDGSMLLVHSSRGMAALWHAVDGEPVSEPLRHGGLVNAVSFSPDNRMILTAGADGFAAIWNAEDGELLYELGHDGSDVKAAAFGANGRILVTVAYCSAYLWDVSTGKRLFAPLFHGHPINAVAISPNDETLVAVGRSSSPTTPCKMSTDFWPAAPACLVWMSS
jgi:hypothetical protein